MDGRTIWVRDGDVEGRIGEGAMVTAARDLSDWCLRGDDGSEPVAAGTVLEIVETRPYGAAMAMETDCHDDEPGSVYVEELIEAGLELEAMGLYEVVA